MPNRFTIFEQGYIDCLFFTEEDELNSDHTYKSFAPETIERIKADCDKFLSRANTLLAWAGTDEQNGMDFWYARNGHGVGFEDRGYAEHVAQSVKSG